MRSTEGTENTEKREVGVPGGADKFARLNRVTEPIIGAAIQVHRALGPGLLESAYVTCLAYELNQRGIAVERQVSLPIIYGGVALDCAYRADLVVGGEVLMEVKCVDRLDPIHEAQMLTYLKISSCKVGLLVNFNAPLLRNGLRRYLNGF